MLSGFVVTVFVIKASTEQVLSNRTTLDFRPNARPYSVLKVFQALLTSTNWPQKMQRNELLVLSTGISMK